MVFYEQRFKPIQIKEMPRLPSTDKLHDYKAMVVEIKSLVNEYPQEAELEIIGRSGAGRDLYLVKVGSGEKKLLVNNSYQSAETTGIEASLAYIGKLVRGEIPEAERLKKNATLLVIPMLAADGVDLYVKLRSLISADLNFNLDTFIEVAEKYPYGGRLMNNLKRLSGLNHMAVMDTWDWYRSYKDLATGLTKYASNFDEWLWKDCMHASGIYTIGEDCWQMTLPESRAIRHTFLKYKPNFVIDLHNTGLWDMPEGITKGNFEKRQIDWALLTIPATSTSFFSEDPDSAIKGTLLRDRFSDSRWLRHSSLTSREKSMPGYLHPEATEWELQETLNISKIASQAVENIHRVQSAPVGWMYWNGSYISARPTDIKGSAMMNPEFECAGVVFETYGGADCGDAELEVFRPIYETVIDSILRYTAGLETSEGWEEFPVFQSPFDVWSKKDFTERKFESVGMDSKKLRRTHY